MVLHPLYVFLAFIVLQPFARYPQLVVVYDELQFDGFQLIR